jgi:hypothetical protein
MCVSFIPFFIPNELSLSTAPPHTREHAYCTGELKHFLTRQLERQKSVAHPPLILVLLIFLLPPSLNAPLDVCAVGASICVKKEGGRGAKEQSSYPADLACSCQIPALPYPMGAHTSPCPSATSTKCHELCVRSLLEYGLFLIKLSTSLFSLSTSRTRSRTQWFIFFFPNKSGYMYPYPSMSRATVCVALRNTIVGHNLFSSRPQPLP